MEKEVHIFFDFVCPFCFLGIHKLEEAIGNKNIKVVWHPYELSPGSEDTLDPVRDRVKFESIKKIIFPSAKKLGISIKFPQISPYPHTTKAFYGMQYAKEMNLEKQYIKKVFYAFFQQGQNIGRSEVLENLAEEIGLEREKFKNAINSTKYANMHEKALKYFLKDININLIPTYIIGKEIFDGEVETNKLKKAIEKYYS